MLRYFLNKSVIKLYYQSINLHPIQKLYVCFVAALAPGKLDSCLESQFFGIYLLISIINIF